MTRRRRTRALFPIAIVCLLLAQSNAHSQSQSEPLPRYEAGVEFTTLGRDAFGGTRNEAGVGGRFTVNLNEMFAVEAAGYIFPRRCFECLEAGRMSQAVAGVKVGKRFDSWGVFAKARPGVVSFSDAQIVSFLPGSSGLFPFGVERKRVTSFAADVGGVVEFYPSRRIVTRFDVGDTIIHFTKRTQDVVFFDTTGPQIISVTRPARTDHRFQFSAGVGFRF